MREEVAGLHPVVPTGARKPHADEEAVCRRRLQEYRLLVEQRAVERLVGQAYNVRLPLPPRPPGAPPPTAPAELRRRRLADPLMLPTFRRPGGSSAAAAGHTAAAASAPLQPAATAAGAAEAGALGGSASSIGRPSCGASGVPLPAGARLPPLGLPSASAKRTPQKQSLGTLDSADGLRKKSALQPPEQDPEAAECDGLEPLDDTCIHEEAEDEDEECRLTVARSVSDAVVSTLIRVDEIPDASLTIAG